MFTESEELNRRNFWIVILIYISIFVNSYVFFKAPFEFYLGYLIYIVLLPVFISRFGFNRYLSNIFLILLITGIFNIVTGNNTILLFFKVFTGLALSYFFYNYVILQFDKNTDLLFRWYLKGCYFAAIIALVQFFSFQIGFEPGYNFSWIFNKWGMAPGGFFGLRINSVFPEPTHLASVMAGAFLVSVHNFFRKENYGLNKIQGATIILVYLLSFSGLGQAGIFLTLIFIAINYGFVRYLLLTIPLAIILFNVLYENVPDFQERVSSLSYLFTGGEFKLGKTHGSSFILYNNWRVAVENFKGNFLFGTGIGSHPVAFEKYSIAKDIKVYGFNLNGADANSMLVRLISETGIFGVLVVFYIIFKFYVRRSEFFDSPHWLISNGILTMILLNLFRQGHYFLNGFPFFVLLYIYNWYSYKSFRESQTPITDGPAKSEE